MKVLAFVLGAFALIMSGCVVAESYGSAFGVTESRVKIKVQTVDELCALTDSERICKAQAIVAFDECDKKPFSESRQCYKDAYNEARKTLIADCDKQKDKDACLTRVPAVKE